MWFLWFLGIGDVNKVDCLFNVCEFFILFIILLKLNKIKMKIINRI